MDADNIIRPDWRFFKEIDFNDTSILQYHIDTRDFHCLTFVAGENVVEPTPTGVKDFTIYTPEEIMSLLTRYYEESGKEHKWRFLLVGEYGGGWELKYIRIYRMTNGKLVLCNKNNNPIPKTITSQKAKNSFTDD